MTYREAVLQDGDGMHGVKNGLRVAFEQATKNDADVLLVVPSKRHLEEGLLRQAVGGKACDSLLKGKRVGLAPDAPAFKVATTRTFREDVPVDEVVIAFWLNLTFMDKVDGTRPPAVVYVPRDGDEGRQWVQQWSPPGSSRYRGVPEVVERALEDLTDSVDMGAGLQENGNRRRAKSVFLILHREGFKLDGDAVRGWAARRGWHPAEARNLGVLAGSVSRGKYRKETPLGGSEDALEKWKGLPR